MVVSFEASCALFMPFYFGFAYIYLSVYPSLDEDVQKRTMGGSKLERLEALFHDLCTWNFC